MTGSQMLLFSDESPEPAAGMHYLYVLADIGSCYVKVGYTSDLKMRRRKLQCGNSSVLVYVAAISIANAEQEEQAIHRMLSAYRIHGEWFDVLQYLADTHCDINRATGVSLSVAHCRYRHWLQDAMTTVPTIDEIFKEGPTFFCDDPCNGYAVPPAGSKVMICSEVAGGLLQPVLVKDTGGHYWEWNDSSVDEDTRIGWWPTGAIANIPRLEQRDNATETEN